MFLFSVNVFFLQKSKIRLWSAKAIHECIQNLSCSLPQKNTPSNLSVFRTKSQNVEFALTLSAMSKLEMYLGCAFLFDFFPPSLFFTIF